MAELLLLLLSAALFNNFVLAQFLGLCPFMGATQSTNTAGAMSLATAFVLTLAATLSWVLYHGVLVPLDITYLNIIVYIVVIAATVQFTELYLRHMSPLLHRLLGIYLPLITTNCAVLGVVLLSQQQELSLLATMVFALGAALGFSLVLTLFANLRERLQHADVPLAFRGTPIALVTAGLLALGFLGFAGMDAR